MKEQLNNILVQESEALEQLISLLEKQSEYALGNKVMDMEAVASQIGVCTKKIAELEMERRGLTNGEPMSKIVIDLNSKELEENYNKIKFIVEDAIVQKDLNIQQLSQGLNFTNRILSILNPDRSIKTYNANGKMKK